MMKVYFTKTTAFEKELEVRWCIILTTVITAIICGCLKGL